MRAKINNFWMDDDPEWEALQRRTAKQPLKIQKIEPASAKSSQPAATEPQKVEISLKMTLPKLKRPKFTAMQKKLGLIGGGVLVVGVVSLLVAPPLLRSKDNGEKAVLAADSKQPGFKVVLPDANKKNTTNGKLAYDDVRKVASFSDQIGTDYVTVSQQQVPGAFKANPDQEVEKLAKSFNASEIITASTPKAYLGTSVKGPQTVIFHKNGLLVFIKSQKPIDKQDWAEYITRLR